MLIENTQCWQSEFYQGRARRIAGTELTPPSNEEIEPNEPSARPLGEKLTGSVQTGAEISTVAPRQLIAGVFGSI